MRIRVLIALAGASGAIPSALCHCGDGDFDVSLDAPSPIAVGATFYVHGRDDCPPSGANDCTSQTIKLDQVRIDDETILVQRAAGAPGKQEQSLLFETLREGSTKVHARLDNGHQLETTSATIRVGRPDRIMLGGIFQCQAPYLIAAGSQFSVTCRRFQGAEELQGTGGAYPLESDVATPDGSAGNTFKARAGRGKGVVRSSLDSSSIPIDVFEASQVTAMTIAPETRKPGVAHAYYFMTAPLEVDGQRPCSDQLDREIAIDTPDICVDARTSSMGSSIQLRATASGTCTLTVTLKGTSISVHHSFPVDFGDTSDGGARRDASSADATDGP